MPDANAPKIVLVRHGETAWSLTGQHTGLSDIPLTPRGEAMAAALKDRLTAMNVARVFTSPLDRARRTCDLAGLGTGAVVDADLVEWDYGDYEGLTTPQIREKLPGWDLFRTGVPGGESPEAVAARADRFLDKVRPMEGDTAVFSSGHFIRMIAARWIGLAPFEAKRFYTATGSVSVIGYEHGRADPAILLWNDVRP